MARFVFGMNVSLDGYVDHDSFAPEPGLFDHWVRYVGGIAGSLYGRRLYEIMRYWDDDNPDWSEPERAFATAWRRCPKWVVSKTLTSVGPNATLIRGDLGPALGQLKAELEGEVDVGGPALAHTLGELGLIDEYRLYLSPTVVGSGKPFFAGPLPPLRLIGTERFGAQTVCLSYAPA
ncbi:dihydrofolate reductase family protein [Pelagovum pacificum]|uniref:Dihydrofolate reductase n=1 Tax=Pelagovum pacificum TaxID=2588711 RepID=A0A5C5GGT2_9RHOB|nr:dihydrofolate reductase family protein [Pelagovum pacificum]QQA43728.1 dihydrofolate reductase family protein [Pelagovum pacificum]TNY33141.1 dihydrofolate reductase [Pelagovum pacificum]